MTNEIFGKDSADVFLSASWRWAVIIGEIKMGDALIEGTAEDGTSFALVIDVAKIVPATEGNGWKLQA